MPSMTSQEALPYNLEALVVSAFGAARARGKADWRRMKFAVLKNRMLQMSRRAFSEQNHEVTSLRELLGRYPTLVRIDGDSVELLEQGAARVFESAPTLDDGVLGEFARVRPDLWEAAVDYSSGKKYAWDKDAGRAREALPGDELLLPTVQRDEFAVWRREFVEAEGAVGLDQWRDEGLNLKALPPELRRKWNEFVKARVAQRFREWFEQHGITASVTVAREPAKSRHDSTTEDLRRVVAACVAVMTADELAELKLPPAAVARARILSR
jgi:hypothetical protein